MRFHFVSRAEFEANMGPHEAWVEENGIPLVQAVPVHERKLAIIGGGPSVQSKLHRLRRWDGDIWAINATVGYLQRKGIKSTLVTVDPKVLDAADFNEHLGAQDALLGACCDPALFRAYAGKVRAFYTRPNAQAPFVASGANTTVTRLPLVAHNLGYKDVTFFGCEGSYRDTSHVGENRRGDKRLYILAGGVRYCTEPYMLVQDQWLADLIARFPANCKEESGGLLRAMIRHPDWTVIGVSDSMKNHLEASRQQFYGRLPGLQLGA